MKNLDVLGKAGKRVMLLGNEAIARGALEAGVGYSSAYPGTPSTEIGEALADASDATKVQFEWAVNEKSAFEACVGAAYSGVRALTAMKHFGFNVASDSIFPVVYTGVRAGLVMVVADDPGGLSSAQSEQDTRISAIMGNIPVLEPTDVQTCKELTKIAFEMSEKYEIPVMLRTTTRINHGVGSVVLGKLKRGKLKGNFVKDRERYYNLTPNLQKMHAKVLKKMEKIEKEYSGLNRIEGRGKIGIITNGISYAYIKELGLKNVKIAKLCMANPISKSFVQKFAKGLKKIIVVEELEPVIENFVRLCVDAKAVRVYGKDLLPRYGELSLEILAEKVGKFTGIRAKSFKAEDAKLRKLKIPLRKPVLCQGCPHRSTFYAAKQVFGNDTVWAGDIGCYILGIFEPFEMQDFSNSMGSGTGIGHGISKVSGQKVVAFMGDSTFFHSGMPEVANLQYNKSNPIVVIMDNDITAMTGHQPHPGSSIIAGGRNREPIRIEDVVRSFGIKNVKVADAFSQKQLKSAYNEMKGKGELGVVVSRGTCRLLMKRILKKQGKEFARYAIDQDKCIKCRICSDKYACPAIVREKNHIWIDSELCWGCSVCSQVCPVNAIAVEHDSQVKLFLQAGGEK